MRFWDTSAVAPLLVEEPESARVMEFLREDPTMIVWWATPVECVSAISRREREGVLTGPHLARVLDRLGTFRAGWHEILPSEALRRRSERLLRVHPLRAADALQLAAVLQAADPPAPALPVVCLDERLATAARREGLTVLPGP